MRKLAKLILFFTITFFITFVAATCFKFLSLRVEWAKNLPPKPETTITLMIAAAHWALSLSLFSSILLALNYIVRREHFPLTSIICIIPLSFFLGFGISAALEQWKAVPPSQNPTVSLGGNGLILNRHDTSVVLLNGTAEPLGPRVTAIPDQPLSYQETASSNFDLPPVPFGDDTPWFLKELDVDIRLNAGLLQQKFSEGFYSYFVYAGSLIFLLCSLGYAIKFSVWPLANLFLATLAFRGVLAFTTFFNTPEIQGMTTSFLGDKLPITLSLPVLFIGFGILVNVYSFLAFIAKRRYDDEY